MIPIDYDVKKALLLFVGLYPTYEKAAEAIAVNRSTIAIYMEGAENISKEVLDAVLHVLKEQVPAEKLRSHIGEDWERRLTTRVRTRNFLQTDHEALELTPELHRFLDYYTRQYPSRIRAARSLGVNPRTYKAYVKETISTLPHRSFRQAVKNLVDKGRTTEEICSACGVHSLDDMVKRVDRPETVHLDDAALLQRLVDFHEQGGRSLRQEAKPLYNLCQRRFGGTRAATAELMEEVARQAEPRLHELMEEAESDEALEHLKKFESALRWFAAQSRVVERGRGPDGEPRWRSEVRRYHGIRQVMRERIYREAPFTHVYMVKSDVEQFRFRHRYLQPFRVYDTTASYRSGELLYHTAFGMGRVLDHAGKGKIRVLFRGNVGEVTLTALA